jgi:hypothetical protein
MLSMSRIGRCSLSRFAGSFAGPHVELGRDDLVHHHRGLLLDLLHPLGHALAVKNSWAWRRMTSVRWVDTTVEVSTTSNRLLGVGALVLVIQ